MINKTKEKGVRQLKQACDKIFNYCLSQWNKPESSGEIKKIILTSSSVDQIIPDHYFANIDQEDNQPNEKEQINKLQKELANLRKEKHTSSQTKLKTAQLRSLNLIQQKLKSVGLRKEGLGELSDYQTKMSQTSSLEEAEALREEVLLYIECQNLLPKPSAPPKKPKKTDNWAEFEKWSKILEERWKNSQRLSQLEIEKLKKQLQDLQEKKQKSTWSVENNSWFILFMVSLILMGGIYTIFKLKSKRSREGERERDENYRPLIFIRFKSICF